MPKLTHVFNENGQKFISDYYLHKLRMLYVLATVDNLNAWEFAFLDTLFERATKYGRHTIITVKQEKALSNICRKFKHMEIQWKQHQKKQEQRKYQQQIELQKKMHTKNLQY